MTTFIIGFDLDNEGPRYEQKNRQLSDAIKRLSGTYWHQLDWTWIVVADSSAEAVRNFLQPYIDDFSKLLVVESAHEAAWTGFNQRGSDWLKKNI